MRRTVGVAHVRALGRSLTPWLALLGVALAMAAALTVARPATAARAATCVPAPAVANAFPSTAGISSAVNAAIGVGRLPSQLAIDTADVRGYVYVANSADNTVSVLAGRNPVDTSIRVVATVPSGGQIPSMVAVDATSGRVYIGNTGSCTIGVIDGRAGGGPRLIASVAVDVLPVSMAVGPDGRLFVVGSNPDGLVVVTPGAGAGGPNAGTADFTASQPVTAGFVKNRAGIIIDPSTGLAFVGGNDVIETVDLNGPLPTVPSTTPLPGISLGLAFDPRTGLLYAADNLYDTISTLRRGPDGKSLQVVATVPAAAVIDPGRNVNPVGIAVLPLRRELVATSYSTATPPTADLTIFAIDPAGALTVTRTIAGIDHSTSIALDPVSGRVFVVEREASRVSVLDLEIPTPLDLAFVMPGPFDLSLTPTDLARNVGLTLIVILLIGAPTPLFNSTLDANEDEIRRWLRRRLRLEGRASPLSRLRGRWSGVAVYLVVSALLYAFLDPKFPFDDQIVAFGSALLILLVATAASILPGDRYVTTRYHEHGAPRAALWTLAVAIVCVVVTRLTNAQPGYIYGIIGGFAFTTALTVADHGRMAFRGGVALLGVGVAAWFLRIPFQPVVGQPQDAGIQLVNRVLEGLFVGSIQGLVFGLVPLRFLTGETLRAWSVRRWLILWGIGIVLFIGVVLYPVSSFEPQPSDTGLITMAITVAAYGMIAVAFWAFFRRRAPRLADRPPAP
ncbi:MAG: FGLLP motif-containing membrane protein [Candidatus Limnocylindrales bacterium]